MRHINKKQLYRLEHSFLDSVLNEGVRVFKSYEHEKEWEFDFRFPLALKHAKNSYSNQKKELMYDNVNLTVKMLIDTTAMPAESSNK